jgi:hypothetical protein
MCQKIERWIFEQRPLHMLQLVSLGVSKGAGTTIFCNRLDDELAILALSQFQ